jgi:hypothetical protein
VHHAMIQYDRHVTGFAGQLYSEGFIVELDRTGNVFSTESDH